MKFKPVKSVIQIDSMDDELRNSLWNALDLGFFQDLYGAIEDGTDVQQLALHLWQDYFKKPFDECPNEWFNIRKILREYYFQAPWDKVYDFIEFIAENYPKSYHSEAFSEYCNTILKRELSDYRLISNRIVPITDQNEISTIEDALKIPFKGAKVHLDQALYFLSDKQTPDYRNSIKESISAVGQICREMTGESTLGKSLDKIKSKIYMNEMLKQSLEKALLI